MDELALRILTSLLHVRHEHGSDAYDRAARRAVKAICTVLVEETMRSMPARAPTDNVFPLRLCAPSSVKD